MPPITRSNGSQDGDVDLHPQDKMMGPDDQLSDELHGTSELDGNEGGDSQDDDDSSRGIQPHTIRNQSLTRNEREETMLHGRDTSRSASAVPRQQTEPPPLDDSAKRWMRDYQTTLQLEQTLLENPNLSSSGNNLAKIQKYFDELCDGYRKLTIEATDDPIVANAGRNVMTKLLYYNTRQQDEEREERDAQQQLLQQRHYESATHPQVNSPISFDNYQRQKDDVAELPAFQSDVVKYATWRQMFLDALEEFQLNDEKIITRWLKNNVMPHINLEMQKPLSQEKTVKGWIKALDSMYQGIDYVRAQTMALVENIMARKEIVKTSTNLYHHDTELTKLFELLRVGDDIMERAKGRKNFFSISTIHHQTYQVINNNLPYRLKEEVKREMPPSADWPYEQLAVIQSVIKREAEARRIEDYSSGKLNQNQGENSGAYRQKSPNKKPHDSAREVSVKLNNVNTPPPPRRSK